jgi:hypothetical protein
MVLGLLTDNVTIYWIFLVIYEKQINIPMHEERRRRIMRNITKKSECNQSLKECLLSTCKTKLNSEKAY